MDYFSHINKSNDRKQTIKEHNYNVANLSKQLISKPNLKEIVLLMGFLNDKNIYEKNP